MVINVEDEMKKHLELSKTDLDALRDWATKQPHFPEVTDKELLLFLHSCYWSLEKAKHTMDTYFTCRTHVPELFHDRDPLSKSMTLTSNTVLYVPVYTPEETVIYFRLKDFDPNNYHFADTLKVFFSVQDLLLMQKGTSNGLVIIIDLKGVVLGHVAKLGLMTMKKILFYLQEAMPVRLKGLHFTNTVPFMDMILSLMKPFMKPELLSMLYLHPDNGDTLKALVNVNILPEDIGGTAPNTYKIDAETRENLIANRQFFIDEEKKKVNENLRPGKAKSAGELFGVEGSFKKLDID